MYYSLIGFLALIILIITNYDVFFMKNNISISLTQRIYRGFLISVIIYYITDMLWGILDYFSLSNLLFFDTEIYFIAMALGILFWTHYVYAYLDGSDGSFKFLCYVGVLFFACVTVLVIVNIFVPIMFWIDDMGNYHTSPARYVVLIIQIILLFITGVYSFWIFGHTSGLKKRRYLAIGLSGFIIMLLIFIQIFYPLLPLYAIGYMFSCCLLRTFVVENEKEEYRYDLETALNREKTQLKELDAAWKMAYTDSLTGAKSTFAYKEKENQIDKAISDKTLTSMGVVVFDLNNLKHINDTCGHDVGDEYIVNAFHMICDVFQHSPVFRIGGDEFVVILENKDYMNRNELMSIFNRQVEENNKNNDVVIAAGMAEFIKGKDNSYRRVFERADFKMYERKDELKRM